MLMAFELSMPTVGSWDGKWTAASKAYWIVQNVLKSSPCKPGLYYYHWDDGWTACVKVRKVDQGTAAKMRRESVGFYGYDWMVDSICEYGEILDTKQRLAKKAAQGGCRMTTFTVRLQVIKVYDVEVNADDASEAKETAMSSQTTEIERDGKLRNVETDHAEIVGEGD